MVERAELEEQEALLWDDRNQVVFFEEQDWVEMELQMDALERTEQLP